MCLKKKEHVLAKPYYMLDIESESIGHFGDLKIGLVNRSKRLNKEGTHACTHTKAHAGIGREKR